ncbi:MAG: hypothetical protein ACRDWI_09860 [Jiangellaceae bacterium]
MATACGKVSEPSGDAGEFGEVIEMLIADFIGHLRGGQLTDAGLGLMGLAHLGVLSGRVHGRVRTS